jgi:hypothetical protein
VGRRKAPRPAACLGGLSCSPPPLPFTAPSGPLGDVCEEFVKIHTGISQQHPALPRTHLSAQSLPLPVTLFPRCGSSPLLIHSQQYPTLARACWRRHLPWISTRGGRRVRGGRAGRLVLRFGSPLVPPAGSNAAVLQPRPHPNYRHGQALTAQPTPASPMDLDTKQTLFGSRHETDL